MPVHWSGQPFVDAGLAALLAAVGLREMEHLTPQDLEAACERLERVLLSDEAMGIGVEKAFVRGQLAQVFPNSELVNPSNWREGTTPEERAANVRQKFREALAEDLRRAQLCLLEDEGEETCLACGERRPQEAMVTVRKMHVPLLEGLVNYYPGFAWGQRLCGLCLLAVRFLPFSLMHVSGSRFLWFLHTSSVPLATLVAQEYGWEHFLRGISAHETLDFYRDWATAGEEGTVLYLLFELLRSFPLEIRSLYEEPLPTAGYIFSNANPSGEGFVRGVPIPHEVMRFLARLSLAPMNAYRRFQEELLQVEEGLRGQRRRERTRWVASLAHQIVHREPILGRCLRDEPPYVYGGWIGHRLYLQEVRGMRTSKLMLLERLGRTLGSDEDARRWVQRLRTGDGGDLYRLLLEFVRQGWLTHEEFYWLVPPNDYGATYEVRDVLLAVMYEALNCAERGEPFPALTGEEPSPAPDETLQRLQALGQRLLEGLPNFSAWLGRLQTARSPREIRGAYLSAVQRGALSWPGFVFLAPLEDTQRTWLLRDYLLAFLFDRAREMLPEEVATSEPTTEEVG